MLIAISDLHFLDHTAGVNPFPGGAFDMFWDDMAWYLARRPWVRSLTLVLLGDTFDLLRTNGWHQDGQGQSVALEDRPWGARGLALQAQAAKDPMTPLPGVMFERAEAILQGVISAAQAQLTAFRQGVERIRQTVPDTQVAYVLGNHDRLLNLNPRLRRLARQALGMPPSDELFPQALSFDDYAVYATHGHQWDPYSYGASLPDGSQDLGVVPIGDAITTELFSRIPLLARDKAQAVSPPIPPEEIEAMLAGLLQMDNVRPMAACVEWLHAQAQGLPQFQGPIEDAVHQAFAQFNQTPFVRDWFRQHVGPTWKGVKTALMDAFFQALQRFSFNNMSALLNTLSSLLQDFAANDPRPQAAAQLAAQQPEDTKYVLMGHTHEPTQSALAVSGPLLGVQKPQVYLNTGTWRPRQHKCLEHGDFIQWKELTYVVVFQQGERDQVNLVPSFDTWTGQLYE